MIYIMHREKVPFSLHQQLSLQCAICNYNYADEETDMLLHDRGLLYYRLLKADVHAAKQIICGSQKIFSEFASPSKAVRKHHCNIIPVLLSHL